MKKVRVAVFFCASNEVQVDAPENLEGLELDYYLQDKLREDLPEVLQGCSFEYPMEACVIVEGDGSLLDSDVGECFDIG